VLQLVPKKSQKSKIAYSMFLGRGSYNDPATEHQVIKKRFAVTGGLNCEVRCHIDRSSLQPSTHNIP
jgi:hypothetical protein